MSFVSFSDCSRNTELIYIISKTFHSGTFLSDYTNKSNLHIAVTDSVGEVVEFDKSGVRRDRSRAWEQCLVVSLADHDLGVAEMMGDPDWSEYWDMCLEQTLTTDQWSETRYHEDDNNCFTFVLTFLRTLNQRPFTGENLIQRSKEIGLLTEKYCQEVEILYSTICC